MEGGSIIEPHFHEFDKVFNVTRRVIRIEANLDFAKGRGDGDARIDFLELHGHSINLAREYPARQDASKKF